MAKGSCRYDSACLFAHGEHEIRCSDKTPSTATITQVPDRESKEAEDYIRTKIATQDDLANLLLAKEALVNDDGDYVTLATGMRVSEAALEYLEYIVQKHNLGTIQKESDEPPNIQECIDLTDSVIFALRNAREDLGLQESQTSSSSWGVRPAQMIEPY